MKLEDLEKYRNKDGYINIDLIGFEGKPEDRETRGSGEREKDWMELDDTSVLLRTELFNDDETKNFCNYAELIFEELAKQIGVKSAHYDLITYKGKKGVLSQDVRSKDEEFFTLSDFIKHNNNYIATSIDLETIFPKLKKAFKAEEFHSDEIFNVTQDFVKMLILDTFTMSTDRHLENCGVLISKDTSDKKHVKFAPLIDNECSLMLDIPAYELSDLSKSSQLLESRCDLQEPLIALSHEETDINYSWQDTIEFLADEEKRKPFFDFAEECTKKLDIQKAIDSVEGRIKAPIPEVAKSTAINSFYYRKQQIIETLMLDLSINDDNLDNHTSIC